MLILPTPYDIDSLYTIQRIQPQIVYVRIQNNNQYQSDNDIAPSLSLFVLRQYQQINAFYTSKGNESKAGETEGNKTNNIMTMALIYCVKIIIAVRLVRHQRSLF
jgi:hypothetical protein